MDNNPIAVVDSGAGGLACLDAIRKTMPNEDIIYFADTLHMPYGQKTKEELAEYAKAFCAFLMNKNVKMIVLACGTLSSTVINDIYKACPMALVQGLVEPTISAAARASEENDKVGLIATKRSIESGAYQLGFERLRKHLDVVYKECPELATVIESGKTSGSELEGLLHEYLDEMVNEDKIKTLVLGCTHYPLVTDTIEKLYPGLAVVNPAQLLAKNASTLLKVHGLNAEPKEGGLTILTSKKTESFEKMAGMLGLSDIAIEEVTL